MKTDHRTRVTKMLIRRALTELLQKKPIQSISITELCQRAGINRGTFYAHYTDLYDLLRQMEEELLADFQKALEPLLRDRSVALTPAQVTSGIFQCLQDNAEICTITLGDYGDKSFAQRLLDLGQERCMEIYSKAFPGATPKMIADFYTFVSAGCMGLLTKWLSGGMSVSAEELASIAERIMTHGMGYLRAEPQP